MCIFFVCDAASAFVGPLGGGFLQDRLGFETTAVVIGSCGLFAVRVLSVVVLTVKRKVKPEDLYSYSALYDRRGLPSTRYTEVE